jgi:hypothetical protein
MEQDEIIQLCGTYSQMAQEMNVVKKFAAEGQKDKGGRRYWWTHLPARRSVGKEEHKLGTRSAAG